MWRERIKRTNTHLDLNSVVIVKRYILKTQLKLYWKYSMEEPILADI